MPQPAIFMAQHALMITKNQSSNMQHLVNEIGFNGVSAFGSIHNHYVTDRKPQSEQDRQGERWLFSHLCCSIKPWQVMSQTNCTGTYVRHSGTIVWCQTINKDVTGWQVSRGCELGIKRPYGQQRECAVISSQSRSGHSEYRCSHVSPGSSGLGHFLLLN